MCLIKEKFNKISACFDKKINSVNKRVVICAGTGCVASGSLKIFNNFVKKITDAALNVTTQLNFEDNKNPNYISKSGCQGFCQMGPLVAVFPDNILYVKVKEEDVDEIVDKTIKNGEIINRLLYSDPKTGEKRKGEAQIDFYNRQNRIILKSCGFISPDNIDEYIYNDGYKAALRAYHEMKDGDICEEVEKSGLRGRGGGGFSTGLKWDLTRKEKSEKKYIICNADEGDPGAFMNRSVMEGNPHSVIEGMLIAAKAVGADEGYIYVRAEYPLAVSRMKKAVEDAEKLGILGENVLGTNLNFKLNVMEGAGAFVCGEETALIASTEGKRGMPLPKPPFPAQKGLWGKPTVINNVETFAWVPYILKNGVGQFRKIGVSKSPGNKTFALSGHVANTGLIEVPFGTTLREIIFEIGGGVTDDNNKLAESNFKAVQIGGPSGGCLTEKHLDLPIDFESVKEIGAMVGSGGLVVMNKNTCMVSVAEFFMQFTQNESCGKCVVCREGTKQMLELLKDITSGKADENTLKMLEEIAFTVQKASLCGLGKTAPNPVLSTLEQFRHEYEAHVVNKRCPAGKCKALAVFEINPQKCKGCSLCAKKCPVDAIEGEIKNTLVINTEKCIKCGACIEACKFDAITGGVA
ncbi:MAG: NADH-ubiquinone oxidoreductase-F iron-sulfur binding region domain-containing protein [Candidatus Muiribacteriota bacterium]